MRSIKGRLREIRICRAIKRSGLFDPEHYLRNNLDVARSCMDPLKHYLRHGWREGRNPSQYFDTKWYLETYPDVAESGLNPLFHYFKYGISENRRASGFSAAGGDSWPNLDIDGTALSAQRLHIPIQVEAAVLDVSQHIHMIRDPQSNKCLVFSHNLDPQEGAPNSLFDLCSGLHSEGRFKPVVISPVNGGLKDRYEELGIPVFIVKELVSPLVSSTSACDTIGILRELSIKLKEFRFSTVIVNTTLGFHVAHAAKMIGLPVIWTIRESENVTQHFAATLPDHWRRVFLQSLNKIDRIVFVSGHTQQSWIKGTKISRLHTRVIPNAIPLGRFAGGTQPSRTTARESLGVKRKNIMLLNVGTVCNRKNQMELIEALELLSSTELAQIKVFLVGARGRGARTGSAASEYAEVLTRRVENSRRLRHRVSIIDETTDVQMYFCAADVFVFTSKMESYPRVILEAMYFKLPLICSPVFGVLEQTKEGTNALYYKLGNPSSLASRIRSLLSSICREALSQGSEDLFNTLPQYNQMVEAYVALLDEIREIELKKIASPMKVSAGLSPEKHYDYWIEMTETPNTKTTLPALLELGLLRRKPKLSILVPVYNPNLDLFQETVNSVFEQAYCNWELCLADDASTDSRVKPFLRELQCRDSRIRVCFRERNGHISNCLNSALEMATGEFCILLDQDDLLAKNALLHLAKELEYNSTLDIVYSDEDKISAEGKRYAPYFKTDFNYELLLTHNYMTHFAAYRTNLMREVGGYRSNANGSQDLDMTLRILETISPERVLHIPVILYHWRAIPGSTALSYTEKSYQGSAGRLVVAEHLKRRDLAAKVTTGFKANFRRVIYDVPSPLPHVSLIIPTRDRADLLKKCITSILTLSTYPKYDILIVDNNSKEQATSEFLKSLAGESMIRVLRYVFAFNYAAMNNWAVRQAQGEILCFINNDVEVITGDWLDEMVRYATQPTVGIVGAKLYYPNDTIQHAGIILGIGRVAKHLYQYMPRNQTGHCCRAMLPQDVSAVTAACMLIRRCVFEELGGFEESLKINYNDVDLCLRARSKGYRVVWTPYAELYHHESASRGEKSCDNKQQMDNETAFMWRRWAEVLTRDPYMNPNLEYASDQT